jgi:Glycosyl transferase family 2
MRVIALLATYNEERFIAGCLEHLFRQGVTVYLIDNCSTDRTLSLARRYLDRGLIAVETLPRHGSFSLRSQLERKEQLASTLDGDWFMHVDADEIHLPPRSNSTLAEAFAAAEAEGCNAVNFQEFTFLPTREAPDHDHPDFQQTMRWYYPFLPFFPHLVRAWRRQAEPVNLTASGGHEVQFRGLRLYPESFRMRHYPFLSMAHVQHKYLDRQYDVAEVQSGWHHWRPNLTRELIQLPTQSELRLYRSDDELDPSLPRTQHYLAERWKATCWLPRVERAVQDLTGVVGAGDTCILVDDDRLRSELAVGRHVFPFLERDGQYWGPPPDDDTAIRELQRLRQAGARYLVFAWPAFWWLEHYQGLHRYVQSQFARVLENEQLVIFDLRS